MQHTSLYTSFVKCLTSGTWTLLGHQYRFLSPALHNAGYYTVDGISDSGFNFEITFEDSSMYLYVNTDLETFGEERYRVLPNYGDQYMRMVHEIRKEDGSGYESPTGVIFERTKRVAVAIPAPTRSWRYKLAGSLSKLWKKTGGVLVKESDLLLSKML